MLSDLRWRHHSPPAHPHVSQVPLHTQAPNLCPSLSLTPTPNASVRAVASLSKCTPVEKPSSFSCPSGSLHPSPESRPWSPNGTCAPTLAPASCALLGVHYKPCGSKPFHDFSPPESGLNPVGPSPWVCPHLPACSQPQPPWSSSLLLECSPHRGSRGSLPSEIQVPAQNTTTWRDVTGRLIKGQLLSPPPHHGLAC